MKEETKSRPLENSIWKRVWTCHKTDYVIIIIIIIIIVILRNLFVCNAARVGWKFF